MNGEVEMGSVTSHCIVAERDPSGYSEANLLETRSSALCQDVLRVVQKRHLPISQVRKFPSLLIGGQLAGEYEVLLFNERVQPICFSLLRTNERAEADSQFRVFCDLLLPFVDDFPSIYDARIIMLIQQTKLEHEDWGTMRIAEHLHLAEYETVLRQREAAEMDSHKTVSMSAVEEVDSIEAAARKDSNGGMDWLDGTPWSFISERYPELVDSVTNKFDSLHKTGLELKQKYTECPIHVAIQLSHHKLLKILIDRGVQPSPACQTLPIHLSMQNESKLCAAVLLEADPSSAHLKDVKYNATPLHWAKNIECIEFLMSYDVDVDARSTDELTPLHVMVMRCRLTCLVHLVCRGADVDAKCCRGNTPLHLAVQQEDQDAARALLFLGASVSIHNCAGKTAQELIDLLEDRELASKLCYDFDLFQLTTKPPLSSTIPSTIRLTSRYAQRYARETVLSLDGGGVRGIVLTEILLELERLTGFTIRDMFDWITGTSTGSYLSLAMSKGLSVRHCQHAYLRLGQTCFVGQRPYNSENVDRFLFEEFGQDAKMADIKFPKTIVPTVMADRRPAVLHLFRNYEAPYDEHFQAKDARFPRPMLPAEQHQWLTVRSSCSAPSYFRATGRYLDGGIIANNPTLDALSEIHKYKRYQRENARDDGGGNVGLVLSLGTGRQPTQLLPAIDLYRPSSVFDAPDVVSNVKAFMELMVDQTTNSDDHIVDRARSWCESISASFTRLTPTFTRSFDLNESDTRALLQMIIETREYMRDNYDEIQRLAQQLQG